MPDHTRAETRIAARAGIEDGRIATVQSALLRQLFLEAIRLWSGRLALAELVGGVAACVYDGPLERRGVDGVLVARDFADPV